MGQFLPRHLKKRAAALPHRAAAHTVRFRGSYGSGSIFSASPSQVCLAPDTDRSSGAVAQGHYRPMLCGRASDISCAGGRWRYPLPFVQGIKAAILRPHATTFRPRGYADDLLTIYSQLTNL
jgi:hypothetical protein